MFWLGFLVALCLIVYFGIGFFFYVLAEGHPSWFLFWPLMLVLTILARIIFRNLLNGE